MKKLIYCAILAVTFLAGCALLVPNPFSQNKSDIIFSHKRHIDMDIECEDCHTKIAQSKLASEDNLPEESDCMLCHERTDGCQLCHSTPPPQSSVSEEVKHRKRREARRLDLVFSHSDHLNRDKAAGIQKRTFVFVKDGSLERKVDCLTCHSSIKESTKASDTHPLRMEICNICHEITEESCSVCHFTLGVASLLPFSHEDEKDWLQQHRRFASSEGEQFCDNCHRGQIRPVGPMPEVSEAHITEKEVRTCVECHRGDILPEEIHDNNYIQSHGVDARANGAFCISCHQRKECLLCHEQRGVIFDIVHPKDWYFSHKDTAKRQLATCAACHQEDTCLGCHQVISPHPANWDRDITSQNKLLCNKCHFEGEFSE